MTKDAFVYGLIDPRDCMIHYVGQSRRALDRIREHKQPGKIARSPEPLKLWLQEVVSGSGFDFTVLEYVPDPSAPADPACWWAAQRNPTALLDAERWWVAYGRASGWPLVNQAEGGESPKGTRRTPEQIEKMRANWQERLAKDPSFSYRNGMRFHTPEAHAKISAAHKGKKRTNASKKIQSQKQKALWASYTPEEFARRTAHVSAARLGKKHTAESKEKIAAAHRGKKLSKETRAKIAEGLRGRVLSPESHVRFSEANYRKWATRSPEQRAEIARKGWATRRKKD